MDVAWQGTARLGRGDARRPAKGSGCGKRGAGGSAAPREEYAQLRGKRQSQQPPSKEVLL